MANQPKKYKKFVATAATATLVASAIVPVASAAEFKDVAGSDHEVGIDALSKAGIINGYADGTFKPNQTINRGQVVKMLGRWLETEGQEIPADWKTVARFSDLPLTAEGELVQYAALSKDAGVFNGSNGNLNYADNMQRQQMAVVIVRAIEKIYGVDLIAQYKEKGHVTDISDLDKAFSAEQRNAIVALEYAGITNVSNFRPAESVTRGQFASFLYRTIENVLDLDETTTSVKAINNTTVEVTFDEEVENVQALNFLISDLEVKNAAVKQTDKKVVVLTTASQTADKEYTVSVDGEKIGTFKGVSAVIPTKVEVVDQSIQGKLGQQVTVKAQVTVAEGASKAGIPVTLFVPGSADGIKAPVTVEALTDENGVATHTYTRYAATTDAVTVYATGDRSKFSTGYVFWGVDTIISITEVTEGATINNGANKTYKVTYKHPETGKPVANKSLNVSFLENINVTADKLQNVTVNGVAVKQLTNDTDPEAAQITTDSKGEATFTVSGTNTAEVTPVVFEANNTVVSGSLVIDYKYDASDLQARAAKVKFSALQADYKIDVTRDGNEAAAIGYENGRKYNVVVKDKDGNLAKNEVVNVAFNEDLDRVISTNTNAYFVELDDNDNRIYKNDLKQITVTTDSKGEASFIIANDTASTYATPVAWIDINSAYVNKQGNLDEGEPKTVAAISYFEVEKLEGASLKVKNENGKFKDTADLKGNVAAEFKVDLVNQSGEAASIGSLGDVTYTIYNTGSSVIYIGEAGLTTEVSDSDKISPNRSKTVKLTSSEVLKLSSYEGKSGSVRVVATGKATHAGKDFNFIAKESTAKFTATNEVSNLEKESLVSFDTSKKTVTLKDKKAIKYTGETGKNYAYRDADNRPLSLANFEKALQAAAVAGGNNGIEITYEVKGDDITFYLKNVTAPAPVDTVVDAAADTSVKSVKVKNVAATGSGNTYNVVFPVGTDLTAVTPADVVVTPTNTSAKVAAATTNNNGTTWTVVVTAANGTANTTYTINASVEVATFKLNTAAYTAPTGTKEVVSSGTFASEILIEGKAHDDLVEVEFTTGAATGATYTAATDTLAVVLATGATIQDVIDAINTTAIKASLAPNATATDTTTLSSTDDATLTAGTAEVVNNDAKLALTFSEAVTVTDGGPINISLANATTLTGTVATGSNGTAVVNVTGINASALTTGQTVTVSGVSGVTVSGKTLSISPVNFTVSAPTLQ